MSLFTYLIVCTLFSLTDNVVSPYPQYSLEIDKCVYKTYRYDEERDEHVFTVEQGGRFLLKLELSDYPRDSTKYLHALSCKDDTMLCGVSCSAFAYDLNMVDIQIVTKKHDNTYMMKCKSNVAVVTASFRFRLIVEGTCIAFKICNVKFYVTGKISRETFFLLNFFQVSSFHVCGWLSKSLQNL